MVRPTFTAPDDPPVDRSRDGLAVALGNASMLGAGYLMLGRVWLALGTTLVTGFLVILMVTVLPYVWFQLLIGLWWLALIAHGWLLAGGQKHLVASRFHRLVAASAVVPVLLAGVVLRADAFVVNWGISDARKSGDCVRALQVDGRIWLGHRVADAPLIAADDETARVCWRLQQAQKELSAVLITGDVVGLDSAYRRLATILAKAPGHERMVEVVLEPFLRGIPTKTPCVTASITDWLGARRDSHNLLDRSAPIARHAAPAALVGCADVLSAGNGWEPARQRYQQLIDRYPTSPLVPQAQEGVRRVTLAMELANARSLLTDAASGVAYCDSPTRYSGAPPYKRGYNRALFTGSTAYINHLPVSWRTTDPANAVLVVCAGEADYGSAVRTCPYTSEETGYAISVTFYRIAIPIKAYELRTGNLVANTKVQISGSSCPSRFTSQLDAPSQQYVSPSASDIQAAFKPLITRS